MRPSFRRLPEEDSFGVSPNQLAKWRASLKWVTLPPVAATIAVLDHVARQLQALVVEVAIIAARCGELSEIQLDCQPAFIAPCLIEQGAERITDVRFRKADAQHDQERHQEGERQPHERHGDDDAAAGQPT